MNQILRLFLLLLFSLLAHSYSNAQKWQSYAFKDTGLSIDFPSEPTVKVKDLNTSIGMLKSTNYSVKPEKSDANFLYSLNVIKYPEGTFDKDSVDTNNAVMQSLVQGLAEEFKSKIVYSSSSQIFNNAAIVYRIIDDVSGQVVKGQVCIKGDIAFILSVFTTKEKSLNDKMDKFTSSMGFIE
jgi:hypothetical protein